MIPETEVIAGMSVWDIQVYPFTSGMAAGVVTVFFFLILSAFISGSETAYFLISPDQRHRLAVSKSRISRLILRHIEHSDKLLATILTGNVFFKTGVIAGGTFLLGKLAGFPNSGFIDFVFKAVVIASVLILFGEIIPKMVSSHYPLPFARFMAIPLTVFEWVFRPLNYILLYSTSLVNKKLARHKKNISVDDLSHALELTSDTGLTDEKNLLEGIVKFGNKNVSEIMRPRVDVIAVDIKSSFSGLLRTINETGYSRIPVCSGSFDQVLGILYVKDLLPHAHKGNAFKWQALIRPPFYVPESKKISTLLEEFQKRKVHLAIVIDEYGGSSGIVTLEDVLEEIVGEITDESDEFEPLFTKISDNEFIFDARVSLGEFCKITDTDDKFFEEVRGEAESLAGLILELKGEIPVLHETIRYGIFLFLIEAVNNRRIEKIKVEILHTEN